MPVFSLGPLEPLTTERLTLRPFTEDDLPFLVELHGDPEVVRFIGGEGAAFSAQRSRTWLDDTLRKYREHGVGQCAVCLHGESRPIGRAGLNLLEVERAASAADGVPIAQWGEGTPDDRVEPLIEVGYTFERAAWGHGYATEAAARWYRHLFEERGSDHDAWRACSLIHEGNQASIAVARRLELTPRAGRVRLGGEPHLLFLRER